jgi:Gpi18-like mannosyltransferase
MFNVAYIYNTVFWGQVDAIFTFWGFAALLLAIEQRVVWSILCLTIALNFKLQALVFIPVVGALLLPNFLTLKGMKKFLLAIIISFFIQIIILLPFILSGRLGQVWHVIIDSVGHYPFPTVGAFNLWTILLPNVSIEGMYKISDETKIGFLSYKQIGQFLFISTVLVSLYPLVNYLVKKYLKKNYSVFPIKNVFLIAALTSLNFYFFNTEMHERYSHPALVCLAAYAFLSKRFLPLILGSISYFLNMERICWYLNLHNDTYENGFLFKPRLIAGLYLILILLLYFLLYKKEKVKVKEEEAVLN